jgi:hypothetical protein
MASVAKHPKRNIHLRHGARIIERHDGAPPPPPLVERDPDLKSWSAHLIWGKKMQLLGVIEAVNEAAAIERAVVLFSLDDARRKRLVVNLRRSGFRAWNIKLPSLLGVTAPGICRQASNRPGGCAVDRSGVLA